MEELFGLSMNYLMWGLLAAFGLIMAVVIVMALRSGIMLKLGLRNIPRRPAQTVLIVVGSMLSAVIMAAAFGTGDAISFSIRSDTVDGLGNIDEVLSSTRTTDQFGRDQSIYFPTQTFDDLQSQVSGYDEIDGMVPYIAEIVPLFNPRTSLSEGQGRIAAVGDDYVPGFGDFLDPAGQPISLNALSADSVFINEEAASELDARPGDTIRLFAGGRQSDFRVASIVQDGGLAGIESTVVMTLSQGQALLDQPSLINAIAVSNRGGDRSGAQLSESVARRLRGIFADPQVAAELKALLSSQDVLGLIEERDRALSGELKSDFASLHAELQSPSVSDQLVSLLSDPNVSDEVLDVLEAGGRTDLQSQADLLFGDLADMSVFEIKRRLLDLADEIGSGVTTFFIIMGLFSVMVGILLIFLIFVMLAAARRVEMGMARAVGAKRSHLIQMFVFEGTAYTLIAAAVGTIIGLAVSAGIVALANRIFSDIEEGFTLSYHFEPRSAIVAYCLGMVITFATVAVSAYRVSRMNIVEAVRDLPETIVLKAEEPLRQRAYGLLKAALRPLFFLAYGLRDFTRKQFSRGFLHLGLLLTWVLVFPVWLGDIIAGLLRLAWPYLRRGWLTFLLGLLLVYAGISRDQLAPFAIGSSLMIVGLGLMLRLVSQRWPSTSLIFGLLTLAGGVAVLINALIASSMAGGIIGILLLLCGAAMTVPLAFQGAIPRPEVIDRLAFTFIGVWMLGYWILPFDTMEPVLGILNSDFEMFFVSGISMVAAAVWTVMYNADLLLRGASALTGRFSKLRPVLITAVAYPMSAKFRTGLTLAMFALVIFTLIVISILTEAFSSAFADAEELTGNWDIQATIAPTSPIDDIEAAVDAHPDLDLADFDAIGGYVTAPVEARQPGADEQRFHGLEIQAVDDGFLAATEYNFKIYSLGYSSPEEVWEALRRDPTLAVADSSIVPSDTGGSFEEGFGDFRLEGLFIEDTSMEPIQIELLEPRTDVDLNLTIIAVLDFATDNPSGLIVSKQAVDEALPFPVPITTYRFRTAPDVNIPTTARSLESAFLANGMETDVLEELIDDEVSANRAFNNLFTAFMGLGLVVGVAALGVISLRAVVERRQQIGVLRAIGYRRDMIQLGFFLESSFVALLGIALGIALGSIISFNIVQDIKDDFEGVTFSVPWLQIGLIVGIAYVFSIVTTILPARQAAGIHPAEALRYE